MDKWMGYRPLEATPVQGRLSTPYWQEYEDLAGLQSTEWLYAVMANDQELKVIAGYRMAIRGPWINRVDDDARLVSQWGRIGKLIIETRRLFDRKVYKNRYNYKP